MAGTGRLQPKQGWPPYYPVFAQNIPAKLTIQRQSVPFWNRFRLPVVYLAAAEIIRRQTEGEQFHEE